MLFRKKYRIESPRLAGWDYSKPGWYFVTICTHGRKSIFGEIRNSRMEHNEEGRTVERCWREISIRFSDARLDEFAIMPNHIHAIIEILSNPTKNSGAFCRDVARNVSFEVGKSTGDIGSNVPFEDHESGGDVACNVSTPENRMVAEENNKSSISPKIGSLPVIIRSFKSAVTNLMHASGYLGPIWQPRFHDHIIRSQKELFLIRKYIKDNPGKWDADHEMNGTGVHKPRSGQPWYVRMP